MVLEPSPGADCISKQLFKKFFSIVLLGFMVNIIGAAGVVPLI